MIPSKSCRQAPCLLHRGRAAFPAEKMACLSTFVYLFNFQLSLSTWFIVSHRTPLPKFNRQVCLVSCSYFGFIFLSEKFLCGIWWFTRGPEMGKNISLKAGHSVDERQDADDGTKWMRNKRMSPGKHSSCRSHISWAGLQLKRYPHGRVCLWLTLGLACGAVSALFHVWTLSTETCLTATIRQYYSSIFLSPQILAWDYLSPCSLFGCAVWKLLLLLI